ncbi:TRAP transporter small permease subunit [Candidatus Halobeggiatoa sp. HSG11]|nr:TRAP transporter small permease subunit [Candidatus Halobeggiatoa sp. HSG11]
MTLKNIIHWIDIISEWTGHLTAWLILFMVVIIVYQASMVALFSIGSVALQELQWHIFAVVFLVGSAYTLKHDEHVRVDIIYKSHWLTDRQRAWIDLFGGLFFLLPFCVLIIIASWPFVYNAFISAEGSPDPGGLPYRFLLKAAIPLGFLLLMLQGIANSLKNLVYLLEKK